MGGNTGARIARATDDSARGFDRAGELSLHAIYETFSRASPVNMATAGAMRYLLDAAPSADRPALRPGGDWDPPVPPAALPDSPNAQLLEDNGRDVLYLFIVNMGGTTFVPGLYRLLVHWPAYVAHVAIELQPLFIRPNIVDACRKIVDL